MPQKKFSINKRLVKEVMNAEPEGKCRGAVFKTDAEYVRNEKGEQGIKKIEKRLKELGYPIRYNKIRPSEWHPIGLRVLSLLVIKEVFQWSDKKIQDMGFKAPKVSYVIKIIASLFKTTIKAIKRFPKTWSDYHTTGNIVLKELDKKKCYAIAQLRNFKVHPLFLTYLKGFFLGAIKFTLPDKKVILKLTKSVHKGDDYDEFKLYWSDK
jgi:hypothetical protein